jgi:hypothetical protein
MRVKYCLEEFATESTAGTEQNAFFLSQSDRIDSRHAPCPRLLSVANRPADQKG